MQITYGLDDDGNGFVDRYVTAPASGSDDWENILSVRVALLVTSVENAHNEAVPYTYVGVTTTPTDPTDFKLRQEIAATAAIRNRVN
jgi:type IV pilus assembly protein PilW